MQTEIEKQYQFYLEKFGLSEDDMSYVQKEQTKQAFMAGFGQAMVYLLNGVDDAQEPEQATNLIDTVLDELKDFWKAEVAGNNP